MTFCFQIRYGSVLNFILNFLLRHRLFWYYSAPFEDWSARETPRPRAQPEFC